MMDGELVTDEDDSESSVKDTDDSPVASEDSLDLDSIRATTGYSKPSMRGLQQVLAQGWLIQRARDMCSFTHDKYRQAAAHMASQQPDIVIMKMCLRVSSSTCGLMVI
jgi:hypothetical protein